MVNSLLIMNKNKRVNLVNKERQKYKRMQKRKKQKKNKFYDLWFLGHNYRNTSQENSVLYEASGPVSFLKCS